MKLSEVKSILDTKNEVNFFLESGEKVPKHFHITEVGMENKHFIDCGGKIREETSIVFQLWTANDYDHRLSAEKLRDIIVLSETKLGLKDLDVVVEYQSDTIGRYDLGFKNSSFLLKSKHTDCLAKDKCLPNMPKRRVKLSTLGAKGDYCEPNSGCC